MPPECRVWSTFMWLLLWPTGAPTEEICSVHSSKEVNMGSSFKVYCVFKKKCTKHMYQDEVLLNYDTKNATVAVIQVVNLTKSTTIACKCDNEPEPCGSDITPGYPPEVPQNLKCIQEGEFEKVNCTWKTGWETHISTSSRLWVQWSRPGISTSYPVHHGSRSALFNVLDKQTQFSVWVNARNSLGSATSAVYNFTLDDIVRPLRPNITNLNCSSRECQIYIDKASNIQLVEIRYSADQENWNHISFNDTKSMTNWAIKSLNPFSLYMIQVRMKFSPTRGLWSEWTETQNMTDEEAPRTPVDAWYFEDFTPVSKFVQLVWKELSRSEARGNILLYEVTVHEGGGVSSTFIESERRTYNVSCFPCNVFLTATNSKGQSPARLIQLQPIAVLTDSVSHEPLDNHSVALFWPMPDSADRVQEILVEWYPTERKRKFHWIRVKSHLHTAIINGLEPAECYEGAVVYLHSSGTKKAVFGGISTWQTVPQEGPRCTTVIKSESVEVKWSEIPLQKRGGCLIQYTIYLEDSKRQRRGYNVQHPQREYTISGLTLGERYRLWVSAWTQAGEGPKGNELYVKSDSIDEKPLTLVASVGIPVFLFCLILMCTFQITPVRRRLSSCCYCLMPSIVPDPANSKWAKECASEKGEMKLHLHFSDSSMSDDEPNTIEVQEVPQETLLKDKALSSKEILQSENQDSQELHFPTVYHSNITSSYHTSLSHESNSSDATQASRNTDITVDYISTHRVMSGEEDDDDVDDNDDDEEKEIFSFFSCPHSPFLEPLISIGKLTLDSVKIDCSDFLDCA